MWKLTADWAPPFALQTGLRQELIVNGDAFATAALVDEIDSSVSAALKAILISGNSNDSSMRILEKLHVACDISDWVYYIQD